MSNEILQCLAASLSSDSNARMRAELRIGELLSNPETALALANILLSQDVELSLRQICALEYLEAVGPDCYSFHSAGIILRKYVNERWSPYFKAFKGNAPPVEIKSQIREYVFKSLSDPNRKIRSSSAHTLSLIANCDWPDEYPDLLNNLITLLSSSSLDSVHGSMQVFDEFIKSDLSEDQILPVLRQLLPVLLNILGSTQHAPLTRARAISVFRQCVSTLFMVKDQHPQAVKEATSSILPVWLEAFQVLLNIPPLQDIQNTDNWDALAIRIEVFKTLDTVHMAFSKTLAPYLEQILTRALAHLQDLLPTFTHYYLSSSSPSPPTSSEDQSIQLAQLGCPIIDFISSATRGKGKAWLTPSNMETLTLALFGWMQMTEEDESNWETDANAFVAQEEDDSQSYSLRIAGLDLLSHLMERDARATTATLSQAISRVVHDSQQQRDSGNREWWRSLEAALAALGSVSEELIDLCDDEEELGHPKPLDVVPLLSDVIPSILSLSDCQFLQGRGFVFASQYAKLLPSQLAGQYLNAAITVMENPEAVIPIKVSAVKAIQNFCSNMDGDILLPHALQIAKDLGPFLLVTSEDTLTLVLETLSSVVEIKQGSWLSPDLAESLTGAMLQVWANNNKDPILVSVLTDIFSTLASSPSHGVYQAVVKSAVPTLDSAITNASPNESWTASTAIDILTSLINGAPSECLGDGFFAAFASGFFKCLRESEDRDVLQNGVTCITSVIRKDVQQLITWRDSQGQTGIDNVLAVIAKLLSNEDESGGLVIGDLIIHLLRQAASSVISVLPQLLQAMVTRMTTAKTATFVQSLVIPFAFLVQSERDTVLSLLETTNVNGRSGLDILIQTWCENAEVFQGFWPSRVSTLGLCQLLASERPSLQTISVKGDLVVKPETNNVIVTRSMAKKTPLEFTQIPFPLKALKLLVNDLRSNGETGKATAQNVVSESNSDDGDDDWEDEDNLYQGLKEEEFQFLSDMLGPRGSHFDDDDIAETIDDEDLKNDSISQMDMTLHLVQFLKECAARNTNNFTNLVGQLNAEEMLVVQKAVNEK